MYSLMSSWIPFSWSLSVMPAALTASIALLYLPMAASHILIVSWSAMNSPTTVISCLARLPEAWPMMYSLIAVFGPWQRSKAVSTFAETMWLDRTLMSSALLAVIKSTPIVLIGCSTPCTALCRTSAAELNPTAKPCPTASPTLSMAFSAIARPLLSIPIMPPPPAAGPSAAAGLSWLGSSATESAASFLSFSPASFILLKSVGSLTTILSALARAGSRQMFIISFDICLQIS
mmetsp:Transcript_26198/g.75020  ORF Transcript_26198/g.75020 Transcript_26198/m.75020 type:complete len:233 (+) Transcript_26198:297-995(+)